MTKAKRATATAEELPPINIHARATEYMKKSFTKILEDEYQNQTMTLAEEHDTRKHNYLERYKKLHGINKLVNEYATHSARCKQLQDTLAEKGFKIDGNSDWSMPDELKDALNKIAQEYSQPRTQLNELKAHIVSASTVGDLIYLLKQVTNNGLLPDNTLAELRPKQIELRPKQIG